MAVPGFDPGSGGGVQAPEWVQPFDAAGMGTQTTGLGAQSYNANGAPIYGANQLSPDYAFRNPGAAAGQAMARAGGANNLENPWTKMVLQYAQGMPLLAKLSAGSGDAMSHILPFFDDYIGALRSPLEWGGTPGTGNALYNRDEVTDVFRQAMAGTLAPGVQELFANADWGTMSDTISNFLQTVAPTSIDPFQMRAMMNDLEQKAFDYQQYFGFGNEGVEPAGAWDWLQNTGWLQRWLGV